MYRYAIENLDKWKNSKNRKPLIIEGARQVGKTWIMKEFGKKSYNKTVYINFDSNVQMAELFSIDLNVERIVMGLELYAGHKINPADTLVIFDEVQEVPKALSSLKYFYENAPEYHIVCAGSLLGIALHEGTSFPVGKVDFLKLYPLSFKEFLMAIGLERFAELLDKKDYDMIKSFKQTYIDALKQYYYVGGMPEVVASFADEKDFNEARKIQKRILTAYEQDFSKHAPKEIVPKIRMLWNSIPSQLTKENKKFIYGLIREGARAKDYETAIRGLSVLRDRQAMQRIDDIRTQEFNERRLSKLKDKNATDKHRAEIEKLTTDSALMDLRIDEAYDKYAQFSELTNRVVKAMSNDKAVVYNTRRSTHAYSRSMQDQYYSVSNTDYKVRANTKRRANSKKYTDPNRKKEYEDRLTKTTVYYV